MLRFATLLLWAALASGCSSLISNVTQSFADSLSDAILNNPDPQMVRDGAPSYLILIDSLVARSPDDAYMLQQSATLHTAYAAVFVEDPERAQLLLDKAKGQALKAVCLTVDDGCGIATRAFRDYQAWVDELSMDDIDATYTLANTWAAWIQANSEDFAAVADLARVKAILHRVVELAPEHDNGGGFLYLGLLETILPPGLGGKPEIGRAHFERALEISEGQNLLAKVMFAEEYARLVFDRDLHDRLVAEVLAAPTEVDGLTLMNTFAKQQAEALRDSADEYF